MPEHYPTQDGSKDKGADFFYLTSNSKSPEWHLSDKKIDDRNSMAGLTILQSFVEKVRWQNLNNLKIFDLISFKFVIRIRQTDLLLHIMMNHRVKKQIIHVAIPKDCWLLTILVVFG